MTLIRSIILIIAIIVTALPALAWDGVESELAGGYITRWFTYRSSPTPRYCDWRTPDPAGPVLQATNADGVGNNDCADQWLVHCSGDSLVYRGHWPQLDGSLVYTSHYESVLACSVNITRQTRLAASRSVAGSLTGDIHAVTIDYPDGSSVQIFPAGPGPEPVELILDPGQYQISIVVDAYQSAKVGDTIDPYEGFIILIWQDPESVAVESTSWGSMKALFR